MRKIGICGTFDIRNYGDLLFPFIAQNELTKRLGPFGLRPYSYHARSAPGWPFDVEPISRLVNEVESADGMIVGGGHIIRFDKAVAPDYLPPDPDIPHPTGYWLLPAVLAADRGWPLVWNAPGVYGEVPSWADALMALALRHSSYIAVRDESSRNTLARFAPDREIAVVPDSGFGVARLPNGGDRSAEFSRLRERLNLKPTYLVVQASSDLVEAARLLKDRAAQLKHVSIVSLPVGPVLGDNDAILRDVFPNLVRLPSWPHPLVIAELIRNSAGFVGSSLHATITALAFGVPTFRPANQFDGKFSPLRSFESIFEIPTNGSADIGWLLDRLGRSQPEAAVEAAMSALDLHWDRLADALVKREPVQTGKPIGRFLQSLPNVFEASVDERISIETDLRQKLADGVMANAGLQRQLAESRLMHSALLQSTSWKITAPMRWLGRILKTSRRRILRFERLASHTLHTRPYEWTAVDRLYTGKDARALAASYPSDKFKTVNGHDGEKAYAYEARALIHLGESSVAFPEGLSESWRRLASDLLSPSYRGAMSRLTGRDLSSVPMEAYVCHFGADAWLGPHLDLKDKILTHVFYFNKAWNDGDGGCLKILNSKTMQDEVATISPVVGNSSILIRSDTSWHAVSKVVKSAPESRRSMNVIFYWPGAKSTMWPAGDHTPLHDYRG